MGYMKKGQEDPSERALDVSSGSLPAAVNSSPMSCIVSPLAKAGADIIIHKLRGG
ncbi:MAG TPA: hypothetical protein VLU73_09395 [Methylococcaceae bacterium]|jgi:hypothetical protein|nr:hypothetical protein [Methylococcaceae bacterium]